jgi:hypothetical protein
MTATEEGFVHLIFRVLPKWIFLFGRRRVPGLSRNLLPLLACLGLPGSRGNSTTTFGPR